MKSHTYKDGKWIGPNWNLPNDYFKWNEKLFACLKNSPDFIGQIDGVTGKEETFNLMNEKSIKCAIWLKKQGIKSGDVVGYCSKNHLDSYVPLFASIYIGAIFNPWYDECSDIDLVKYFVELTKPKVVFIDDQSANIILKTIPVIDDNIKFIGFGKINEIELFENILNSVSLNEIDNFKIEKVESPDTPAVILFTSGTSGTPKAALHTYGSIGNVIGNIDFKAYEKQKNIGIWFATLCWGSGFFCAIKSILIKSTSIIQNFSNEESSKLFQKYKITWFMMGTGVANKFYKNNNIFNYDFSSVIEGTFGGVVISIKVEDFLVKLFSNATIKSIYGCTEFLGISGGPVNDKKPASAGKIHKGIEVKVINPKTMKILGPNEEGEFCARGKVMMVRYWNNLEATKNVIDAEGWYHTGDLGYYDEDGYIWIIDRLSSLIKYKNHNIPTTIIENVIRNLPGVFDVGVVGKPHEKDTEQVTAFITKSPETNITENDIIKLIEVELPEKMWLRGGVYFLTKMPYTSRKVNKKELRLLAQTLL